MAFNKIEAIKAAKHPLDVLEDIYRYAKLGWEAIPEDDWDRMKWYGVFFRRATPGYFMMRLRIPNGILSTAQLRTVADIVCDYGRDQADLTTRENIQLRWVTIENVPDIFERLRAVGLTSQQSGMDNMRNVVGCPIAGLDPTELLDASFLAEELQGSFVGVRELSNLPRKFNISITGCREDCGHAQAHDLSFVPATRPAANAEPLAGFNVLVGGALGGRDPQLAVSLDAFVLPDEVVALNWAVLEVFRDHGPREARNRARLKVLLAEWGIERFRAAVEKRFGGPLPRAGRDETAAYGGDHIGVHPQRQPGRCYAGLLVPVGRVTGTQLRELARLADAYGAGEVRLTPDQNVIIPHVLRSWVPALLREPLLEVFSPFPSEVLRGLVACTGTDYCHFSLIDTKTEALTLARLLEARLPEDRALRIHMSGCPNACGQHWIADVGLLGVRVRKDGQVVEAADVSVGGRLDPSAQLAREAAAGVPLEELADVLAGLVREETRAASRNTEFSSP